MATQDIVTIVLFDAGATANNNMLEQMQLLEAMRVAQSGRAGELDAKSKKTETTVFKFTKSVATTISLNLGRLNWLHRLDLSHNQIREIPSCIGALKDLREILMSNNRLIELPVELTRLKHLQKLKVDCNLLETLPERIGKLKHLRHLDVASNRLETLPLSLAKCTELQTLSTGGNPLVRPPAGVTPAFLQRIARRHSAPANMARVMVLGDQQAGRSTLTRTLAANHIGERFKSAKATTAGQNISVDIVSCAFTAKAAEPATRPAGDMLQRRATTIGALSASSSSGGGGGGSSAAVSSDSTDDDRSSLRRRLSTPTRVNDSGDSPGGNDADDGGEFDLFSALKMSPPRTAAHDNDGDDDDDDDTVSEDVDGDGVGALDETTFVLWDFAPDFYHHIHAAVLDPSALNLVVWRLRDTARATIEFWLLSIAQMASSYLAKGGRIPHGGVPVILVATGLDDEPYSTDPDEATAVLQQVADRVADMDELHQLVSVKGLLAVSNVDGRGIEELQEMMEEEAPLLTPYARLVPPSWYALDAALQCAAPRRSPFVSKENVKRIATVCGVEDVSGALEHLTYAGRIIAFDQPLTPLDEYVLVDPSFVYTLAQQFARASSKPSDDVDQAAFKAALRTTDRTDTDLSLYPANTHRWLLALLRRVGLTLSLPGIRRIALVPSLPTRRPSAAVWPPRDVARGELRQFHLLSLASTRPMSRLVQRLSFAVKPLYVWQHGMLFTTRPLDELKQLVPRAIKAKADEKKSNQKDDEDDSKKSKKKTGDNDDDLLRDLPADALLGLVELSWDRRTLHQAVRWKDGRTSAATSHQALLCAECSQDVGEQYVKVLDKCYHLDCIQCANCNRSVVGEFVYDEENKYCGMECAVASVENNNNNNNNGTSTGDSTTSLEQSGSRGSRTDSSSLRRTRNSSATPEHDDNGSYDDEDDDYEYDDDDDDDGSGSTDGVNPLMTRSKSSATARSSHAALDAARRGTAPALLSIAAQLAPLMDELNAAKSRRMLLVEQTAATGGRMKAGKVSRTDEMRMTSLLDSMKDESARVSDEITQLEQRIHKLKTTGVDPYQLVTQGSKTAPKKRKKKPRKRKGEKKAEKSESEQTSSTAAASTDTQSDASEKKEGADEQPRTPTLTLDSPARPMLRHTPSIIRNINTPVGSRRNSLEVEDTLKVLRSSRQPSRRRVSRNKSSVRRDDSLPSLTSSFSDKLPPVSRESSAHSDAASLHKDASGRTKLQIGVATLQAREDTPLHDANEPLPVPAEAVTFFRLIGDQLDHALDDANNDVRTLVACSTCVRCGVASIGQFDHDTLQESLLQHGADKAAQCSSNHAVLLRELIPDVLLQDIGNVPRITTDQLDDKKEIGRGAFGTIYSGTLTDVFVSPDGTHRSQPMAAVALKELMAAGDAPLDALAELRAEICAMHSVPRNPTLVALMGFSVVPPLALVLELCTGDALYNVLHSKDELLSDKMLTWRRRVVLARDIARGVAHMHRFRLLHRDIKSPNVLCTAAFHSQEAKKPHAKLADFGTACTYRGVPFVRRVVDQPVWLAPEVMLSVGYGLPSDVFSLGIVLWEVASRQHPWNEFNYGQFMVKLEEDCIAGVRPTVPQNTPPVYRELIEAAWHANPSERPVAGELVQRLDALLGTMNGGPSSHAAALAPPPLVGAAALPPLDKPAQLSLGVALQSDPLVVVRRATLPALVSCITTPTFGTAAYRCTLMQALARNMTLLGTPSLLFAHLSAAYDARPTDVNTSQGSRRRRHIARRLACVLALKAWYEATPDDFRSTDLQRDATEMLKKATTAQDNELVETAEELTARLVAVKTVVADSKSNGAKPSLVRSVTDKAKHDAREQETEVKPSESHLRLSMSSGNLKPEAPVEVDLPVPTDKIIKSLWLPTMDVADLASQLTLFEHSFVRLMTPRALLAWDTEYLELIEVYGDALQRYRRTRKSALATSVSHRVAAQRREVAPVLLWLGWARRQRDWVATELLSLHDDAERARVLCKFVKVARHCVDQLQNYQTAAQIVAALRLRHVDALTGTWAAVPKETLDDLKSLAELLLPAGGASAYRAHIARRGTLEARVPLLSVLLSDIADAKHDMVGEAGAPAAQRAAASVRATKGAPPLPAPPAPTLFRSRDSVRKMSPQELADDQRVLDVRRMLEINNLLVSLKAWQTQYKEQARQDVQMMLLSVEVLEPDTLEDLSMLRETGASSAQSSSVPVDSGAVMRSDLARLWSIMRCHSAAHGGAELALLEPGQHSIYLRPLRAKAFMCVLERGSASRRQRSHKLEVLRAASALVDETLVGVEELFGLATMSHLVAEPSGASLRRVNTPLLLAVCAADAALARAFYHHIATVLAHRLRRVLTVDPVKVSAEETALFQLRPVAPAQPTTPPSPKGASTSSMSPRVADATSPRSATASPRHDPALDTPDRPHSPASTEKNEKALTSRTRARFKSLFGNKSKNPVAELELSSPQQFQHKRLSVVDLEASAAHKGRETADGGETAIDAGVFDQATQQWRERFAGDSRSNEVAVRSYACRTAQNKRKGVLYVTPLAVYFYCRHITATTRRRIPLASTLRVASPPVAAAKGAELTIADDSASLELVFANVALRNECSTLVNALVREKVTSTSALSTALAANDATGHELLRADEWASLANGARVQKLVRDDVVIEEGSTSRRVFIVQSGVLRLEKSSDDGAPVLMGYVTVNESVGADDWLVLGTSPLSVVVHSDRATLLCLTPSYLDKRLSLQVSLAAHLYQMLALHLIRRSREFELLLTGTKQDRDTIEQEWKQTKNGLPPRLPLALRPPQPLHSSESKTRRKSLTVTGASSMVGAKVKRSSGAMDDLHTMPLHVERHVPFEGSVSMSALPTPALSIDSDAVSPRSSSHRKKKKKRSTSKHSGVKK